jgi:NADH-quinone oxidoreductase subunit L
MKLALIALLPLAGFLINALLGHRLGKRWVGIIACALPLAAFALTLRATAELLSVDAPLVEPLYTWARIGTAVFSIDFYFDRLTAVMTLVVTGVGSLIHIYSTGYMHEEDERGYARYFAYLNLFLFFMLLLVLGRSLLVLFVGWEGVGLASYLLIGFWFQDPEKAAAGNKAFIVNRIGDAGFLLGMFLLYMLTGTLDMDRINALFVTPAPALVALASVVGVLLFIGACGKSAQIPLYVWLPDAMAGPTPVSALIHAATMVTAGVYLLARMHGVYEHAPQAGALVATIGVTTAFFAATIATVQTDIKKVLAYSTISQLGLMFVAAGVGAYAVAIFHVVTHAFFKACLFLGAGSVIHALGGEQDVRKMGGLARRIPLTFVTFAIATAAIAGIPSLAGFFSKDEILWFAYASPRGGSPLLWAMASLTALLTAYYMFRLLWLTFFGRSRMSAEVDHHVHESPWSMTGVLLVLALLSAVGGFIGVPHFLAGTWPLPVVDERLHHIEQLLIAVAVLIGFAGLALAALFFSDGARRAARLQPALAPAHRVLSGKYFIDELYERLFNRPLLWLSERVFLNLGDKRLLDGTLDGLAGLALRAAGRLGRIQTGNLHLYALLVLLGLVFMLAWGWRHA